MRRPFSHRLSRSYITGSSPEHPSSLVGLVVLAAAVLASCGGGGGGSNLPPEAAPGGALVESAGCVSCHGGRGQGFIGPAWQGLLGTEVKLADGTTVIADSDYVRRSILDPSAELVAGFEVKMPENQLTPAEVDQIIDYMAWLDTQEPG